MAGDVETSRGWRCPLPWQIGQRVQPDRLVKFPCEENSGGHPKKEHYAGNRTTTTKYNLLTFIPKSLFEQYR